MSDQPFQHQHVGRVDEKRLDEVSGCAASRLTPDVLWIHNDGDAEAIHAIRTDGTVLARLLLPVRTDDIEDIATVSQRGGQPASIYVADVGDNKSKRDRVRILRLPEPDWLTQPSDDSDDADPVEIWCAHLELFSVRYPERSRDAETLLVDPIDGVIYVVTKEKDGAEVFRLEVDARGVVAPAMRHLASLSVRRVSAGDISADGSHILLRREEVGWLWQRPAGTSLVDALKSTPREVPVRTKRQSDNGEAIGFTPDGRGYWTISEGKREIIARFRLPN